MWQTLEMLARTETLALSRQQRGWATVVRWTAHGVRAVRALVGDEALRTAAALAYTSILAMVPLLAVSFGVLRAFVSEKDLADRVSQWMIQSFLAESVGMVTPHLEQVLDRAGGGTLGVVGFSFLLVTSLSLFLNIERAFNNIWRVTASRPLHRRLTSYYSVITLTPALLGLGFAFARWMEGGLAAMPFGFVLGAGFVDLVLTTFALLLMYRLLPHAAVRWRTAFLGAAVAAAVFQLSKWGFNTYVDSVWTGSVSAKVYGSLALVPVFFLWIYLVWIIVLGGGELAFLIQNRDALGEVTGAVRKGLARPSGYLLARVFHEIARHFCEEGGGITPEAIAGRLHLDLDVVHAALRPLRAAGLVLEVEGPATELLPARALDRIRLEDLFALAEVDTLQAGHLPAAGAEALEAHLRGLREAGRVGLQATVESFVRPAPVAPAAAGPSEASS